MEEGITAQMVLLFVVYLSITSGGMKDTMPRKLRQLRSDLQQAGFYLERQTGSHQIWKHSLISGVSVNLVGKDSADAKPYQEREIQGALWKLQVIQQRRHKQ